MYLTVQQDNVVDRVPQTSLELLNAAINLDEDKKYSDIGLSRGICNGVRCDTLKSTELVSDSWWRRRTKPETKPRILILADSHGRSFGEAVRGLHRFRHYDITSFYKAGADLEDVVSDLESLASDFGRDDCVVIMGGSNNALKGKNFHENRLLHLKRLSYVTNVIVVLTPY